MQVEKKLRIKVDKVAQINNNLLNLLNNNLFLFIFKNFVFVFLLVIDLIDYTEGNIEAKMFENMILSNVQK